MALADRLARGVKAVFIARLADILANAALVVILARYLLSPDEYGLLYYALSVFGVVTVLGTVGIPASTARYIAEFDEQSPEQVPHVIRTGLRYLVGLSLVVGLTISIANDWLAALLNDPGLAPLLALGAVFILARGLRNYLTNVFQGLNRVTWSAVVNATQAVGRVIFAVAFILLGFGVVGALAGFIVGFAVAIALGGMVLYAKFYRHYAIGDRDPDLTRRLLEYSVPLTATRSAGVIDKRVDTLLVGFLLNATAVGYYTVAKQIAEVCATPATSLGFTISPAFGEQKAADHIERAARLYEQALEYVLLLYVPAVVGIFLLANPIIQYIFGADYLGAVPVLQVLSVFVLATAVVKITSDGLDFLGRARDRAIAKSVMAAANFGLNLLLIPILGVVGAAVATLFTYSLYTLATVYIISRELPLRFRGVGKALGGVTAVSLVMGGSVTLLIPYISGVVSLLGVVAVGLTIWGIGVAGSGLLDVRQAVSYLV